MKQTIKLTIQKIKLNRQAKRLAKAYAIYAQKRLSIITN